MPETLIDLRSDTVTRPTSGMMAAMSSAPLGDDVYGEDPTINRLQERLADLLGKEAAVFVPSGTMSNQIGVRVHCGPGDEFLCEIGCHIFNYEQGAYAQLSGICARPIEGTFGVLRPDQLQGLIRPENEHLVRTRLVCLENTHNRGGGRVQPYDNVETICKWAHDNGLATHLDGARLFNAVVASGISARQWAQHFDTVNVCFSKGLGAPVGSALAGTKEQIALARRHRKLFGGSMRQAGVLAAAALYALDHHIDRLAVDHANAQALADGIRQIDGLELRPAEVDTNLVIFQVEPELCTAPEMSGRLKERGVLINAFSPSLLRAVTHLDVDRAEIEQTVEILADVVDQCRTGRGPRTVVTAGYV